MRAHWMAGLALTDEQADELMADYWTWYRGTLDQPLVDWFAAQRPARKSAILGDTGPGAREGERVWGFEAVTGDIVYSHEVGLRKPDPAVYALSTSRLGCRAGGDRLPRRRGGQRRGGAIGRLARRTPRRHPDLDPRAGGDHRSQGEGGRNPRSTGCSVCYPGLQPAQSGRRPPQSAGLLAGHHADGLAHEARKHRGAGHAEPGGDDLREHAAVVGGDEEVGVSSLVMPGHLA